MTAACPALPENKPAESIKIAATNRAWWQAGTFETIEAAQLEARRLQDNGMESAVCLIDGLSVLVRRN